MTIATRHPGARPQSPPLFSSPLGSSGSREARVRPMRLSLVELDPREVVEGVLTEQGFMATDVVPVGPMREVCPHCPGVALQLVLRHHHVKRSHLFCRVCTRCYDALGESGQSILVI